METPEASPAGNAMISLETSQSLAMLAYLTFPPKHWQSGIQLPRSPRPPGWLVLTGGQGHQGVAGNVRQQGLLWVSHTSAMAPGLPQRSAFLGIGMQLAYPRGRRKKEPTASLT